MQNVDEQVGPLRAHERVLVRQEINEDWRVEHPGLALALMSPLGAASLCTVRVRFENS